MSHPILEHLQEEHQDFAKFLYSFRRKMKMFADPHQTPDWQLTLNMLDYINLFPEQFHHPIEDEIFRHLEKIQPENKASVEKLIQQHRELEKRTEVIREGFTSMLLPNSPSAESLVEDTMLYIHDQMDHLLFEEEDLFPLIDEQFSEQDWIYIEQRIDWPFNQTETDQFRDQATILIGQIKNLDTSFGNQDMDIDIDTTTDN